MSRYAVEVVLRRIDDKGHIIEETLMHETATFDETNADRVVSTAAVEAAMLVHDVLA